MSWRNTARLAAIGAVAVGLAIATPTLGSAQGLAHHGHATQIGANKSDGAAAVPHSAQGVSATPRATPAGARAFPSSSSTVVASEGFLNGTEVGYFWSVARGDKVEQAFGGPAKIKGLILKLDVPENFLSAGNETDWAVSINGKDVGGFQVVAGQLGRFTVKCKFGGLSGGTYDVEIRMTNEIPSGEGSIALTYAGSGQHSIRLCKK